MPEKMCEGLGVNVRASKAHSLHVKQNWELALQKQERAGIE
jgi:hypothetical protein